MLHFHPTLEKSKYPLVSLILIALIFGFFCAGIFTKTMHMRMMDSGIMSTQSELACCNINTSHSFNVWKSTIVITPEKIREGFMLIALALVLSFISFLRYRPPNQQILRSRFYIRDNPNIPLFNQLRLAFARGILNPKVF